MTSLVSRVPLPAASLGRDALGAAVVAVAIAVLAVGDGGVAELATLSTLAGLVACLALVWRRAASVAVLLACALLFAVPTILTGEVASALIPLVAALYTVVSRVARIPVGLAVGAAGVVGVAGVLAVGSERAVTDPVVVSAEIWMALVAAVGVATNLYRRSVAHERERARQAEETREAVARGRVAEERLRIARELHDAVGHHVAVMNVQAGVAEALIDTDPARASEALVRVQEAGARVLEELPVMLRVLRQDEEDVRPTAGVASLADLVAQAADAGLEVAFSAADVPDVLPAATDHAAYRIVQEALANARRYGTGEARVKVALRDGALAIDVRNAVDDARPGGQGSGLGLVGMAERVDAAGGGLAAGRQGDEFVVHATLPVRKGTSS
ncbi:sensor histidine kinase [Demequina gelatinilytica]|uniref:sensor histidine kinase n=1 Tax=Demequina gelatinilytica TaxID=1638980 RepID=UPI000783C8A8|nr:histidine kinase [Demequina gelatinilytica]